MFDPQHTNVQNMDKIKYAKKNEKGVLANTWNGSQFYIPCSNEYGITFKRVISNSILSDDGERRRIEPHPLHCINSQFFYSTQKKAYFGVKDMDETNKQLTS